MSLFGDDNACYGHFGDIPDGRGGQTKGIQVECPDGAEYGVEGEDYDTAKEKLRQRVLQANCNDDSDLCNTEWEAEVERHDL